MEEHRRSWFVELIRERSVQLAAVLWVALSLAVFPLSHLGQPGQAAAAGQPGHPPPAALPFDRPAMAGVPLTAQVAAASLQLLFTFVLMALTAAHPQAADPRHGQPGAGGAGGAARGSGSPDRD